MEEPGSGQRPTWQLRLLTVLVPVLALAAVDLGLRALALVPPESPLLFFARSREAAFSPFVEQPDGSLSIRPEWVVDRYGIRQRRLGKRAGRHFLYPGFRPARIAMPKPPGAIRIVALGGSTTFGLFVGADAAFPAVAGARLREVSGDRPVEVVNLGCPGWASDRVLNVLDSVLALEPDLVVVYSGHNEMLEGDVGVIPGSSAASETRVWLLKTSTIFRWLDHGITAAIRSSDTEMVREEMAAVRVGSVPTFDPREIPDDELTPPTGAFVSFTVERYARNAEAIHGKARAGGVPVLFVLPIANLLYPPSLSAHGPGFDRPDEFHAAKRAARRALLRGDLAEGLRQLDRASDLSPRHAMTHYRRAEVLLRLGRRDEARAAFQRAVDLDVRTHRITSAHEAALIEALERNHAEWIDLRPVFRAGLDPVASDRLFHDHLHPTDVGHAVIADEIARVSARMLGLPPP